MKKVLVIALMLLIPCAAFGMETLTIDEMAEITGQSGVAIALDDVKIFYGGSETWYQSNSGGRNIDNKVRNYHGAIGLIGGAEMFYANAVMIMNTAASTSITNTLAANFYSPGRPLMYDYSQHARNVNVCAYGGFNFGNTRNYGTVTFGAGDYTAIANNAAVNATLIPVLEAYYGITDDASAVAAGPIQLVDVGFASKAITIRVVDRLDVISEALENSLSAMNTGMGTRVMIDALVTAGTVSWSNDWLIGRSDGVAFQYGTNTAKVGGVTIGLPTAELYREGRNDLNIRLFVDRAGTSLDPGNPLCDREDFAWNLDGTSNFASANSWSFGKIYYNNRTTFILDGFIEITPFEAYVNPVIQ